MMPEPPDKIGILGGTFDPVHNGHLAVAEVAGRRLTLSEILFIPTGMPWQKAGKRISPARHRVRMVELAIGGRPGFKLSKIEVGRSGPTYTVDTLEKLKQQYGDRSELYFILGWDTLQGAPCWKDPAEIIRMCFLVAVPRPGIAPPDIKALEKAIPGMSERLVMLDEPNMDVSASDVRRRVAEGLPFEHLVPAPVGEYIKDQRLYVEG